jgi:hypothetical protein
MEIFFLAHNRREMTEASLEALRHNTDWKLVEALVLYDDRSTDGAAELLARMAPLFPCPTRVKHVDMGGPVAAMNDYITERCPELFAKIDNDVVVPRGWLRDCLAVMDRYPWVDLLGIEAMRPVKASPCPRNVEEAGFIGGIGLMRGRAFQYSLPRPGGRFGFTAWQESGNTKARKGWLNPALPVFLLDRLPFEPWVSLSREYVAKGWQREWPKYDPVQDAAKWEWWAK